MATSSMVVSNSVFANISNTPGSVSSAKSIGRRIAPKNIADSRSGSPGRICPVAWPARIVAARRSIGNVVPTGKEGRKFGILIRVVMNAGRAEQIGTPADVYGTPATTFVASFIGSPPMNLLRGRLDSDGRAFAIEAGDTVALPSAVPTLAGRDLLLGIRPEHLEIADDLRDHGTGSSGSSSGGSSGLGMIVEMVEVLGADMLVHAKSGDQPVIVRLPDGRHPAFGERIVCRFDASRVHWFDPASGARIAAAG